MSNCREPNNPPHHARLCLRIKLDIQDNRFRATAHGMTIQLNGLRTQVDPHWKRGLSYLKIGLRWLKRVLHKGRDLFLPTALLSQDIQPCFASRKAKRYYYDAIWFSRIQDIKCHSN